MALNCLKTKKTRHPFTLKRRLVRRREFEKITLYDSYGNCRLNLVTVKVMAGFESATTTNQRYQIFWTTEVHNFRSRYSNITKKDAISAAIETNSCPYLLRRA
jgi:hypothetical protein